MSITFRKPAAEHNQSVGRNNFYQFNLVHFVWLLFAVMFGAKILDAQTLNWTNPVEYTPIQVGGEANGFGGTGTANFLGRMYVAYTDNAGSGAVRLVWTQDGANFSPIAQVAYAGGAAQSVANPSLAVLNGVLYVAWVDFSGNVNYATSSDGVTFSYNGLPCARGGSISPSLTTFNGAIYLGYKTASNVFGLCIVRPGQPDQNFVYSQFAVGMSPALGTFNNNLYVAFRNTSSDHFIYLLVSSDGTNFSLSTAATGSHTGTADSVVIHNGVLYIGFRENSSGNHFFYTYSTNGASFSSPIEVNWTMGGPPSLVDYNNVLYNFFRQNDSGHFLFSAHTQ